MSKLSKAAEIAVHEVLGVREGEEVIIITNFEGDVLPIARELYEASAKAKAKPVVMVQPRKTQYDFAERLVLDAVKSGPEVIISMCAHKVGKDPYGMNIGYMGRDGKKYDHAFDLVMDGDKRSRSFWSPGATVDMFERTVAIDYKALRALAAKLKAVLDDGSEVRVTSPGGTDLIFSIDGRKGKVDDGNFQLPGSGGNLPCGEAYVSPKNQTAEGVIVFDGTIDLVPDAVIPKTPVKVVYKGGFVTEITGGKEADLLLEVVRKGEQMARDVGKKEEERNARALGELGIGINPAARMTCNMLEDEKVWRTVHFAIGANLENDANAFIHQDCLVKAPDLWVDGKQVMRKGDIVI
ncbi:MAG: aminopeptidase [Methanomassiliicoccales archaeon]|nr:aminopeptidase [Methanomassiliicoccales archaeon]